MNDLFLTLLNVNLLWAVSSLLAVAMAWMHGNTKGWIEGCKWGRENPAEENVPSRRTFTPSNN